MARKDRPRGGLGSDNREYDILGEELEFHVPEPMNHPHGRLALFEGEDVHPCTRWRPPVNQKIRANLVRGRSGKWVARPTNWGEVREEHRVERFEITTADLFYRTDRKTKKRKTTAKASGAMVVPGKNAQGEDLTIPGPKEEGQWWLQPTDWLHYWFVDTPGIGDAMAQIGMDDPTANICSSVTIRIPALNRDALCLGEVVQYGDRPVMILEKHPEIHELLGVPFYAPPELVDRRFAEVERAHRLFWLNDRMDLRLRELVERGRKKQREVDDLLRAARDYITALQRARDLMKLRYEIQGSQMKAAKASSPVLLQRVLGIHGYTPEAAAAASGRLLLERLNLGSAPAPKAPVYDLAQMIKEWSPELQTPELGLTASERELVAPKIVVMLKTGPMELLPNNDEALLAFKNSGLTEERAMQLLVQVRQKQGLPAPTPPEPGPESAPPTPGGEPPSDAAGSPPAGEPEPPVPAGAPAPAGAEAGEPAPPPEAKAKPKKSAVPEKLRRFSSEERAAIHNAWTTALHGLGIGLASRRNGIGYHLAAETGCLPEQLAMEENEAKSSFYTAGVGLTRVDDLWQFVQRTKLAATEEAALAWEPVVEKLKIAKRKKPTLKKALAELLGPNPVEVQLSTEERLAAFAEALLRVEVIDPSMAKALNNAFSKEKKAKEKATKNGSESEPPKKK